jgi:hypothetical protein
MHDIDRTQLEMDPETYNSGEFNFEEELPGGTYEGPFNEAEVEELAMELLSVQSEEELDQFLGGLIKRAGRAVGKFARGPVGKALGGVLRGAAKAALPAIGGALGSFIPIPGVGTAIGTAAGRAIGNALEMEGVEGEDHEFEVAKKLVQVAGAAAQQAASMPPNAPPQAAAQALRAAMQQQGIQLQRGGGNQNKSQGGAAGKGSSGRWFRRGNRIVLVGV